ncbi:EamA family transporter RarD [Verrucomicrobiaceae bacterium R5-34]|uniref:EamA family transporter RarD n=1 Tax=Oceaniferula flava TaxID=2800421 RepID=A0AAE2SFE1_9BACT|nr:EamA family transporter RarD [Oceaniferula flavus]MBK1829887.1 EamA family transporter RarD [Verrucomicrobiaceae bacterium R5-34]MBK1856357.1 EamA family transporter RarD [Oceaniferula flavus]MBM1137664.1 EamA family transporter RarD [Oceaniferula flavus]
MQKSSHGTSAAVAAFVVWGVLPLFWKTLEHIPVLELTAHRVVWTLVILVVILTSQRKVRTTLAALRSRKIIAIHLLAAVTLSSNWLIYVWATLNDRILEGALGYYINPFLYILLGRLFLGEKHSRLQMLAIAVAAGGVALQFRAVQGVPWAALGLAFSFAVYGMIRKKSPLGSLDGLALEASLMLPLALAYLLFVSSQSTGSFGSDPHSTWLLIATGAATATPLLLFARGARAISLSLLGILQFIGPTGQFLIGWLTYHEPLPPLRLVSFALIWLAVGLYIFSLNRRTSQND